MAGVAVGAGGVTVIVAWAVALGATVALGAGVATVVGMASALGRGAQPERAIARNPVVDMRRKNLANMRRPFS